MSEFTEAQRAAMRRVARAERDGAEWVRVVTAGERVTFASLERRGVFERRAWRGDGVSRDSAFEYRIGPAIRAAIERRAERIPS